MGDFERVAEHIPDSDWTKEEALDLLLRQTLAMSMEVRAGRLSSTVLPLFANRGFERYIRRQDGAEPQADELFEQRYTGISLSDPAVPAEVLGMILIEGLSDGELLRAALRKSRYFADAADLPAWRRAWYGFDMSDAEYEAALAELETEFTARTETEPGIIYHIVGIRLKAAEIGALPFSSAEILSQSKAYADELKVAGRLMSSIERPVEMDSSRSYDGLGFSSSGTPEFREFVTYYYSLAQRAAEESYAERARAVIAKLDVAPGEFRRDLSHNDVRSSPYYGIPILAAIPADEFVSAVLKASASAQVEVFRTFKQRYDYDALHRDLAPERDWLIKVRQKLLDAADGARPMTRYRLKGMVEDEIDPLLKERDEAANAD